MRIDDSIISVYITFDELMAANTKDTNRCGELTKENALAKGFKEKDWDSYIRRATITMKNIVQNGYSSTSLIRIVKCSDDGKLYLLDGQGRRMALKMLAAKGKRFNEIHCLYYKNEMTSSEIDKAIKELNTGNKNWSTDNLIRSEAMEKGGDTLKAFETIENYKESFAKHGVSISPYMAKYVFFKEKGSHIRSGNVNELSTGSFHTFSDIYSNEYRRFVVNASYVGEKQRTSKAKAKISNQSFAIGIMQVFGAICDTATREYKNRTEASAVIEKEIASFVDKMLAKCSEMNDKRLIDEINLSANAGGKYDKNAILTRFLHMSKGNGFVRKYLTAA